MDKLLKQVTYILGFTVMMIVAGCSENIADEITTIESSRLFSPIDFEARVINKKSVRLTWKAVSNATSYNIEVFDNEGFTGSPVKTATSVTFVEVPYTISDFEGDTEYFVRVQAIGEGLAGSKWMIATFKTDSDQIFEAMDPNDIETEQATVRWSAGSEVTQLVINPGNVTRVITEGEKESGIATIGDLVGETAYTVVLKNGNKTRGTVSFSTLVGLRGKIVISPEDNLVEILDAAAEGAVCVVFPGEYTLSTNSDGTYVLAKSVSLIGYRPNDKPIIHGRFRCSSTVDSLKLKTLVLDGNSQAVTNVFEVAAGCAISSISISDCEMRNYKTHLIYNNTANTSIGDVSISNCVVSDFLGSGGDGIDIRNGTITSFTVENTTFNTGFRAFLRMQPSCSVAFKNCTFYRISNVNDSNNSGLFRSSGGGTLEVSGCLFVETGVKGDVSMGNWCKVSGNMVETPTYQKNYYYNCYHLWEGLYTSPTQCAATEADPGFKNPEGGDFTITNIDFPENIGDPRWW